MKKIILTFVAASMAIPATGFAQSYTTPSFPNAGQPGNARVGACYAVTLRAAEYNRATRQVIAEDAYDRVSVTQAQVGPDRVERFEAKPAHTVYVPIAPEFEPITENVVTRPAYEILEAPAIQTRQVADTYTIREPRLVWRRGANLSSVRRVDSQTGEVYCLVEEMGRYETVSRTVRTSVGDVRRTSVPARITPVTRYRQTRQAGYQAVPVAAVLGTTVYNDVNPGSARSERIAAVPRTIQVETLATDERYELVEVACETVGSNAGAMQSSSMGSTSMGSARSTVTTPGHVVSLRNVQSALKARGLYRGPIDGILGSDTSQALRTFQRQNSISSGSLLSIETLRRLGL